MKSWFARRVWLIFWVVCLGQVALWYWWITFAMENRPQMIEPSQTRPAAAVPVLVEEEGEIEPEEEGR